MENLISIGVFAIGFLASFLGTLMGGGGGLIVVPALVLIGLPPNIAVATNRFGAIGSASSSITRFHKAKKIAYKYTIPLVFISVVGSAIGARLLIEIDEQILSRLIGAILLLVLPLTIFKKDYGLSSKMNNRLHQTIGFVGYFAIAIYDGFFGAAAGIFAIYLFIFAFGLKYIEANATEKIPWLANIIISTIIFAAHGLINYFYGILLLAGTLLGGYTGAHLAIKKGDKFVKILVSLFVLISAIKLIFF